MPTHQKRPSSSTALLLLALAAAPVSAAPFRYAEDQAPAIVNPMFATTMSEARVNELLFEALYTDDKDLATTPQLAERAQLAPDRMSQVVWLRQDVSWHDGERFDADDVVFTVQAMKDKGTASTEAGRVSWIKNVEKTGDFQVRFDFNRAESRPEDKLFFKILPAHRFTGSTVKRTDDFRTRPTGTGPFSLERYNDDNSISMVAAEGYRGETGLAELVMREVSDKNYQAKLLLYESLEALVRVLPRDLAVLKNNRKVELYPYQTNSWWYLGFNQSRKPFDQVQVRQAVGCLVDVEALLAPVGTGDVISGPFVKSSPYYNHNVKPWSYEPDKAATLLGEAGYTRSGDQWIGADGRPLALRVTAHKSLEAAQEVVINLQSQLQSNGVRVDVDFLDDASWKSTVWRDRNFDIVLSQWSFDRNEDVREQFHSQGSRNFTGYKSTDVDTLLDRARDATDPQEKKQALRQVHAKVRDDLPMVFLWTLDSYSAMSTKVRNVVVHPFYFFTWASDWQMK
jgi:peptide/nickel transport system substrate-binding protein